MVRQAVLPVRRIVAIHYPIALFLAFGAAVEMDHFRYFQDRRDPRMVTTFVSAVALLYMASEALNGGWPRWK